jgi:ketosteroid isomerase-like protein
MASENVRLVREIYDRWEAGDFSSVEWAHPEIEYALVGGTDPSTYRGPEAMGRAWADWLSSFDDFGVHAEEIIDAGERVLVMVRFSGRGKGSGVSVEDVAGERGANLFELRDGKVVRLLLYPDRDVARREIELSMGE